MSLINAAEAPRSILDLYPEDAVVLVNLLSRQSGDTFAAGVTWKARRKPPHKAQVNVAGGELPEQTAEWILIQETQTVPPTEGDQIADASGIARVPRGCGGAPGTGDCRRCVQPSYLQARFRARPRQIAWPR